MFQILEIRENIGDVKLSAEHIREYNKDLERSISTYNFIFCKFNFNIRAVRKSGFNVPNVQIYHFRPNAGKYGPEKLRIWTLFTQSILLLFSRKLKKWDQNVFQKSEVFQMKLMTCVF